MILVTDCNGQACSANYYGSGTMACNGLGATAVSSCTFTTQGIWLLDISINAITSISAGAFNFLAGSLFFLYLDINSISKIDPAALTGLSKLDTV